MASKFFQTFESRANALKKTTTSWADEEDDRRVTSHTRAHNYATPSEHAVGSDEDDTGSPKTRFTPSLTRPSNKIDPPASSSVFANRPIGVLLRPSNQKEVKAPMFKPTTLTPRPRSAEQQSPSQDLSAILTKLSLMENKMTSLIESKTSSLERKLEVSEKRLTSAMKAIEGIGTTVESYITDGIKVTREDMEHIMTIINDCTKHSGSILATQIDEINEKIANMSNQAMISNVDDTVNLLDNEIAVITKNNPHDTVHRVSVEDLMHIVKDNTVYVCSSVDELMRDIDMVRQADFAEQQDDAVEEV